MAYKSLESDNETKFDMNYFMSENDLSVGFFTNWRLPTDEDLRLLETVGARMIAIGVPSKPGNVFIPKFSQSRIEERFKACRSAGLETYAMVWGKRAREYVRSAVEWINGIPDDVWAILDAEKDWHDGEKGFSPEEAASVIDLMMNGSLITTGLGELHDSVKPLVRDSFAVIPQPYSIWRPDVSNHWSHSPSTFPGYQQIQSIESWSKAIDISCVSPGLSCYWAERPGSASSPKLTAEMNLTMSVATCVGLGCREVWFWCLEWLKVKRNKCLGFFGL